MLAGTRQPSFRSSLGYLTLLTLWLSICTACTTPSSTDSDGGSPETQRLTDSPLEKIASPRAVSDRFIFSEGPLWSVKRGVLYLSDILTNQIYLVTPPRTVKVFRKPSDFSNGLAFDPQGRLLAAERTTRRVTRTKNDGSVEALAPDFEGKKFHGPNDLTVRKDGTVYFTDPPYFLDKSKQEIPFNGVFRVAPTGKITAEWKGASATRPNGIILSPDETRLYFADAAAATIWRCQVKADGSLGPPKRFVRTGQTPDGMCMDTQENLYVATAKGIEVFAKDGKVWGVIALKEQPSNCTFGDAGRKSLYITARQYLFRIPNMPFAGSH